MAGLVVTAWTACGGAREPRGVIDEPAPILDEERWYRLTFRGAPIGYAVEREAPGKLVRTEHVVLRRGDAVVTTDLAIEIEHGGTVPSALRVTKREGDTTSVVVATRSRTGWRRRGETRPFAPGDAVPTELVPVIVRASGGRFRGPVIITGWDLAVGSGVVVPTGPRRLAARMTIDTAAIDAAVELDAAGDAFAIVDSTGVAATRTDRSEATAPFTPPDVIAGGSIELPAGADAKELAFVARATAAPPALPGQAVVVAGERWRVALSPSEPPAELDAIVRAVGTEISPTFGPVSPTAGDCTTYALALHARLVARGIPARVVTGYVLDGTTLVRHRWVLATTRAGPRHVDASAPGDPRTFFGIRVHGEDAVALAAASIFDLSLAP